MDRRFDNRIGILREVECIIEGRSVEALLSNLSKSGCMISTLDGIVEEGSAIEIALSNEKREPGKVVWQNGNNAGVQFDKHLSPEDLGKLDV